MALGRFDAINGIGEETTCSSEQAVAVMSHPYEWGRDARPLSLLPQERLRRWKTTRRVDEDGAGSSSFVDERERVYLHC